MSEPALFNKWVFRLEVVGWLDFTSRYWQNGYRLVVSSSLSVYVFVTRNSPILHISLSFRYAVIVTLLNPSSTMVNLCCFRRSGCSSNAGIISAVSVWPHAWSKASKVVFIPLGKYLF